jgi:hypothetical protein
MCRADRINACSADCSGVWGGAATEDLCGVCGGTAECADCAGVAMGPAVEDRCMVCDTDTTDDCTVDCLGAWGGAATLDDCDVCNGDGTTCTDTHSRVDVPIEECPTADEIVVMKTAVALRYGISEDKINFGGSCFEDSEGRRALQGGNTFVIDIAVPNGQPQPDVTDVGIATGLDTSQAVASLHPLEYDCYGQPHEPGEGYPILDQCGSCGGSDECLDCANVLNGPSALDNCGQCDASTATDCRQDCAGVWGGGAAYDACQLCGGDGSSCADCASVPNGLSLVDECGVCDTEATDDCARDCAGVWGGVALVDECGTCGGTNDCIECGAGQEKDPELDLCKDCPGGTVSVSWETCTPCLDGYEPNQKKSACASCPAGKAGTQGQCVSCPLGKQASDTRTGCVACPVGKHRDEDVVGDCAHCMQGEEPSQDHSACINCALGLAAGPHETGGVCKACWNGTRPTRGGEYTVRAHPGRLSALSVFPSKSILHGVFLWARRALNRPFRRFPARAAGEGVAVLGVRGRVLLGVRRRPAGLVPVHAMPGVVEHARDGRIFDRRVLVPGEHVRSDQTRGGLRSPG